MMDNLKFKEDEIPINDEIAAELRKAGTNSFLSKEAAREVIETVPLMSITLALI